MPHFAKKTHTHAIVFSIALTVLCVFGAVFPTGLAYAETCTSSNTTCSQTGYRCQIYPRQSEGNCVPKTTCSTSDRVCPTGTTCRIAARHSDGVCRSDSTTTTTTDTEETTTGTDAATSGTASGQTLTNPLKAGSIPELLAAVLGGAVQIGSIFLVLALVWVGFLFVTAQGAEEKIKSARAALMWTVVGGLILLGAQGIALVIQATVSAL